MQETKSRLRNAAPRHHRYERRIKEPHRLNGPAGSMPSERRLRRVLSQSYHSVSSQMALIVAFRVA